MGDFFKSLKVILTNPNQLFQTMVGVCALLVMFPHSVVRLARYRNSIWLCFDYSTGTYSDFFVALYHQAKRIHPEWRMALLITPVSKNWKLDSRYQFHHYIPEILYSLIPRKIVIHPTELHGRFLIANQRARHVQINHGFGSFEAVLGLGYIKNVSMFFANTEYQVYQLTQGVHKGILRPEYVKRIGYPKIDGEVSNSVEIKPKIQSIFYGPTYHRDISSIFQFLDPLVHYCALNNVTLYIKLHPLLSWSYDLEKSGGIDWVARIRKMERSYPQIELLKANQSFAEVVNYFHKSDLFITDNSGLGYEFVLITGKPIVFLGGKLKIPLEDVAANRTDPYSHFPEIRCRGEIGPIISVANTFGQRFDELLGGELRSYKESIEKFREEFTFNLGNAAQPGVDALSELAHELD